MGKYHDQELIQKVAKSIKELSEEEREAVLNDLSQCFDEAQTDVDAISAYTAPEDAENRLQTLYYYQDLFKELS